MARLAAGIVLIFLGLVVLGISYYAKTTAESNFDTNQCGNILGAVVGALFTPEAQACQQAQTISTFALLGEVVGAIMAVLGVIVTAVAATKSKPKTETAPVSKPRRVENSNCKICGKYVDWWQNAVQEDTSLLHEKCYNTMGKRNDS